MHSNVRKEFATCRSLCTAAIRQHPTQNCFERVRDELLQSVGSLEKAYVCEIRVGEKANDSNRIICLTIIVPTEFSKPWFGREKALTEWVLETTCNIYLLNDAPNDADPYAVTFHFSDGSRRLNSNGKMEGEINAKRFDGNGLPNDAVVDAALEFAATWFALKLNHHPQIRKRI